MKTKFSDAISQQLEQKYHDARVAIAEHRGQTEAIQCRRADLENTKKALAGELSRAETSRKELIRAVAIGQGSDEELDAVISLITELRIKAENVSEMIAVVADTEKEIAVSFKGLQNKFNDATNRYWAYVTSKLEEEARLRVGDLLVHIFAARRLGNCSLSQLESNRLVFPVPELNAENPVMAAMLAEHFGPMEV